MPTTKQPTQHTSTGLRMARVILPLLCVWIPLVGSAQMGNDDIRTGNKLYKNEKYVEAEIEYRKALQKNNRSFEANYNLGNALFRQGKYPEAFEQYKKSAPLSTESKQKLASNFHNMGNTFMTGQQYKEAIEAYKQALINNPKDNETRYNLAYAQAMLQKQQNRNEQNGGDDNRQKNQNPEEKPQDNPRQENENNPPPPQQQPQMSKETAQQILNALEQDAKEAQERAGKVHTRSNRRIEKDW